MLTFFLPVGAAILCAIIESLRIFYSHGFVPNINKFWTVTIAIFLFGACLALSVDYYDDIMPDDVLWYALYYTGWRGLIYDMLLNYLRGLPLNYISATTNSIIDRIFVRGVHFLVPKFVYLIIVIIFGYLWRLR